MPRAARARSPSRRPTPTPYTGGLGLLCFWLLKTGARDWIDLALETDPADIAAAALLEAETFTTTWTFDALGRVTTQTTPDASVTTQTFGAGGLLQSVAVNIRGAVTATAIITNLDYNARGQRTLVAHGNGSETTYTYDPRTFRVRRIHTWRPNVDPDLRTVQDLRYHHDPSGNITRIRDNAQQGVFFDNAYVDATQSFTYDPTYRLIRATGREHAVLTMPTPDGFAPISHPQDTQAQRNYTQEYTYDPVGNIRLMTHKVGSPGFETVDWKRAYDYSPDGTLPQVSNRLRATSVSGDDTNDPTTYSNPYEHDAHGNMTAMPHIDVLTWDEDDRLQSTDRGSGGITYYVYDSAGQRVRKVHLNAAETTRKQRLYFGAWELYREEHNINTTPVLDLERATLHVHDDTGRICLIETKTAEDDAPIADPANIARYQYTNHLGTASLELDDDAEVISYEEFHPYGTSSYAAANSAIEVSSKRYRYTGQERDEETGLAYHGARYYAPWLARWTAADPAGLADGPNRYSYVNSEPIAFWDPDGRRKFQGAYGVGSPVHETLTLLTIKRAISRVPNEQRGDLLRGINDANLPSLKATTMPNPGIAHASVTPFLRGVVWPDDPEGLTHEGHYSMNKAWGGSIIFAGKVEGPSPDPMTLTSRTHFGELSFLHGMVQADGEDPQKTQAKILRIFEFYVDVATGRLSHKTKLKDTSAGRMFFSGDGETTVEALLGGANALDPKAIRRLAAGALLHLIQDSYSEGHTVRDDDGMIVQFQSYANQDHRKHAKDDVLKAGKTIEEMVSRTPGAAASVEMGARILEGMDRGISTESLVDYARFHIFPLSKDARASGIAPAHTKTKYNATLTGR